jgi:hypothetical protein
MLVTSCWAHKPPTTGTGSLTRLSWKESKMVFSEIRLLLQAMGHCARASPLGVAPLKTTRCPSRPMSTTLSTGLASKFSALYAARLTLSLNFLINACRYRRRRNIQEHSHTTSNAEVDGFRSPLAFDNRSGA